MKVPEEEQKQHIHTYIYTHTFWLKQVQELTDEEQKQYIAAHFAPAKSKQKTTATQHSPDFLTHDEAEGMHAYTHICMYVCIYVRMYV